MRRAKQATLLIGTIADWPRAVVDLVRTPRETDYRTRRGVRVRCRTRTTDLGEVVVIHSGVGISTRAAWSSRRRFGDRPRGEHRRVRHLSPCPERRHRLQRARNRAQPGEPPAPRTQPSGNCASACINLQSDQSTARRGSRPAGCLLTRLISTSKATSSSRAAASKPCWSERDTQGRTPEDRYRRERVRPHRPRAHDARQSRRTDSPRVDPVPSRTCDDLRSSLAPHYETEVLSSREGRSGVLYATRR